jgi:hypothetical protein
MEVARGVRHVEFPFADFGECFLASASGLDECSVDVEEDESDHAIMFVGDDVRSL